MNHPRYVSVRSLPAHDLDAIQHAIRNGNCAYDQFMLRDAWNNFTYSSEDVAEIALDLDPYDFKKSAPDQGYLSPLNGCFHDAYHPTWPREGEYYHHLYIKFAAQETTLLELTITSLSLCSCGR